MGQGPSGPEGPKGQQGPRGDTGPPGTPGKDATVDLKQVTDSIIVNKTFQNQLVPLVSKDTTLSSNVSKEIANDTTFSNTILNSMAKDERFKGPKGIDSDPLVVATALGIDNTFQTRLAPVMGKDTGFINNVGQQLVQNTAFSNSILNSMANDNRFKGPAGKDSEPQQIATVLAANATFANSVSQQVSQNNTFSTNILNTMATDTRFKGPKGQDATININTNNIPVLAQNLASSNSFVTSLAPFIAKNNELGENVANNIASNTAPRTLITSAIMQNQSYRDSIINAMAADARFRGPRGPEGAALNTESLRTAVEPRSLWCADGQMCKTPTNSPGTIITGDLVINGNNAQNNVRITQGNIAIGTSKNLNIGSWTISENTAGNLQFSKNGFTNGNVIFDAGRYQSNQMTITAGNFIGANDVWTNYSYVNNLARIYSTIKNTAGNPIASTILSSNTGGALSVDNIVANGYIQTKKDLWANGSVYIGTDNDQNGWRLIKGGSNELFFDYLNEKRNNNLYRAKLETNSNYTLNDGEMSLNIGDGWRLGGGADFYLWKKGANSQFRLNGGGNNNAYLSGNLTQNFKE